MKSAMKQSGRSWLPDLEELAPPGSVVIAPSSGLVLFGAVPGEIASGEQSIRHWTCLLDELPADPPQSLTLMIGPEGGWTASERERLLSGGAVPLDLGPHVLRTETAAAAGLFALQSIRSRVLVGLNASDP